MTIPKFRAYIKATGEMRQVTVLDLWMQTTVLDLWMQTVETIPVGKETKTSYLSKMKLYSFNEIELMQYTGLKDINKTEIYDGDLLRAPPVNEYEKKTYNCFEVFFHDNDACDSHIGWQLGRMHCQGNSAGGYESYRFIPEQMKKLCLIGNIHQNPELLEK